MNLTQRYRWLWKPLLFALASLPAVRLLAGAMGWAGASLGADPVDRLLHTLGETALSLLLLTLLVSPASQLLGAPALLRLRRMLGLFAFFYALLHFIVYAWLDQGLDAGAFLEDIVKRPYITIGMLALLLMLPLAVTSTNGMMRRLGRRWQTLHRLVYPIAVLGVWHFWWQVKRDIREPLFYAALLAALLGYRLWRKRLRAKSAPATTPGKT